MDVSASSVSPRSDIPETPELAGRLRLALATLMGTTIAFSVADVFLRPQYLEILLPLKAAHFLLLALLFRLLRHATTPQQAERLGLFGLGALLASSAFQGYLSATGGPFTLSCAAILLGVPALVPWSLRTHAALGCVALLGGLAHVWLLPQEGLYPFVGIVISMFASLFIVREMNRSRREAVAAAARLQAQERALHGFLENAHDLIQWTDGEGQLVYVNRSWREALGYGDAEARALRIDEIVAPESLAAWNRACERLRVGASKVESVRTTLLARSGNPVLVDGHLQGSDEHPGLLRAMLRDVTERHLAEAARRETQAFLRSVLSTVPNVVMTIDLEGRLLFLNWALPGYSREDAIGREVFEFLDPSSHAAVRAALARALERREVTEYEALGAAAHGSVARYRTRVAPIEQAGEVQALVLVSTDITEAGRLEEAREQEARAAKVLLRIARELFAAIGGTTILTDLCRVTTEAFGCDASHVWLVEKDGGFRMVAGFGDTPAQWEAMRGVRMPEPIAEPLVRRLVCEGVVQVTADATPEEPVMALARRHGVTASVVVPLHDGEGIFGVLTISYRGRRTAADAWIVALAAELGGLAAEALRAARVIRAPDGGTDVDNPRIPC